jgi:hypothetical protein
LIIVNEACKPIEVMVPVPQPKKRRALAFPVYVKLFRCSGGCDIEPRLSRCIATGWSIDWSVFFLALVVYYPGCGGFSGVRRDSAKLETH